MKALRRNSAGTRIENISLASPADHQSLLKIELAGICRTDIYAAQGCIPLEKPLTIGHEFYAKVVESHRFEEGSYVSAYPFLRCQKCAACLKSEKCIDEKMIGLAIDGAFAEFMIIDNDVLIELPPHISKYRGAFLEPIAASLAPIERLEGKEKRKGYLIGSGRIAALAKMILEAHGFGNFTSGTGEECEDASMDWVVEADASRINSALRLIRPGGLLIAKSRPADLVNIDMALAVRREITISAVHYGCFEKAAKLLGNQSLPLEQLFGETFALEEYEDAFSRGLSESKKLFFDPTL